MKILDITVTSKTASEMAEQYGFSDLQKSYLSDLTDDKNNDLWNSLIFGLNLSGNGISISSLTFENETANDAQKKVVAVAVNSENYGISARSGYCQAWVADVYQVATGSRGYAHCALCAANEWSVSTDWSQIPVGATVYAYSNSQYGHVGIYIGNGMVIHNIGTIVTEPLAEWIEKYNGFCWGWENNMQLC